MDIENTIKTITEKYSIVFDTFYYNKEKNIAYCNLASEIISEATFLNTLISRNKSSIVNFTVSPKLPLQHWDLFENNINYFSSHKGYEKELSEDLLLCSFLSNFFYIDIPWKKENAEILEKLIKDADLISLVKYYTGFEPKTILRETSYYYDDEVWAITKKYFNQ